MLFCKYIDIYIYYLIHLIYKTKFYIELLIYNRGKSCAGVVLTILVWVVYEVALRFEG